MLSFIKEKLYVEIDNDGVNVLRRQFFNKFTTIFMEFGYLVPFHWFLVERIVKREDLLKIYETWAAKARLPIPRVLLDSLTSVNSNGFFYNGMYRTNDNLIIDLALMKYSKTRKDNWMYAIQRIWTCLEINRKFRRNKYPQFTSIFLYIRQHIMPLLLAVKRLTLGMKNIKLLIIEYESSSNWIFLTMSQLIKSILPSWEIGPPCKRIEFSGLLKMLLCSKCN